jgi:phage tail-like protein
MALDKRRDPYLGFNFLVEIEGLVAGGFREVTGLQAEVEVCDYREGGRNGYIHRLAGPARYPANLVLKHGMTDDRSLWQWHLDVRRGIIQRRNVSIIMLDSSRSAVQQWHLERAYPVRWVGPDLRADANEVAMESLEFAHCGLSLV